MSPLHLRSLACGLGSSVLAVLLAVSLGEEAAETGNDVRPNFILMMVDDLGIGDVGCYGNDTIRTPNIDRLAQEGVKLTQHIAAAPLCTPSRAAFMTGRYPLRSGLGGSGRVQVLLFLGGSGGLPQSEITFAKLLQRQGYSTGIVGKWHLGVSCENRQDHCHHPNQHGFDYFYGLPFTNINDCKPGAGKDILVDLQRALRDLTVLAGLAVATLAAVRFCGLLEISLKVVVLLVALVFLGAAVWYAPFADMRRWNCIIMRNQEVVQQPMDLGTLTQRLMGEAERFVERNQHNPFLLFLSLAHVHVPLFVSEGFAGKSQHGLYGDNVEEADWMIGRMVHVVDRLGLAQNTLLYFTSDHGGHIEDGDARGQRGGWNGIYRGGKGMGGWEGGIRVPGVFRWPGRLPAGRVIDQPTSLMDLYPTLVTLAGGQLPHDRVLDGHDLMPLMEGRVQRSEHEFMFHYCGAHLNAVRWHPPDSDAIFKAHFFTPNFSPEGAGGCYNITLCSCQPALVRHHRPALLFDLARDPSESAPLSPSTEPRYAEALRRVGEAAEAHARTLGPVPEQLTWERVLWRPWLQPCCGTFPFCSCSEANVTTARLG
ncbi:hypothetical protein COCON_G00193690 [Conger conger]|uniref:Sulfatase N-terminal domain-containing protein n=1 Tax=Conger conger TaxID=82655 RepID=A0A9Q1D0W7_CONCO|nr:arylsulfatase D [Conger conger]KAJ8255505.1 hypothetical protein COCON_G00193690 [Conger conger]